MASLASGARLEIFETLESTSAEAKRRASAGETGSIWIIAKTQTAGYGRRSRAWNSGAGNFAGTLLFEPKGDPASFGQLSFVAALAVLDALDGYATEDALSLKWPNDILAMRTAKIAGLLLERVDYNGKPLMALGIGINLASAPDNLTYPAAHLGDVLSATQALPTPEGLVQALDTSFNDTYELWRDRGMEVIRLLWLERAQGVGKPIIARLPNETVEGIFAGIDETGALILDQQGDKRLITAGEIMFGRDANDTL